MSPGSDAPRQPSDWPPRVDARLVALEVSMAEVRQQVAEQARSTVRIETVVDRLGTKLEQATRDLGVELRSAIGDLERAHETRQNAATAAQTAATTAQTARQGPWVQAGGTILAAIAGGLITLAGQVLLRALHLI